MAEILVFSKKPIEKNVTRKDYGKRKKTFLRVKRNKGKIIFPADFFF